MVLQELLIRYCSPTLAGLKTGNMFSLKTNGAEIGPEISRLNRILTRKGLRLIPLQRSRQSTLIYLYRPEKLEADLNLPEAADILSDKGYPSGNPEKCIVALIRHLVSDETFPHEIGLFLGYPPSDVKGFMNSPSDGVQCVGSWKAYGNPAEAERKFECYRKCTNVYCRVAGQGTPLERLAVDCRRIQNRKTENKRHLERSRSR